MVKKTTALLKALAYPSSIGKMLTLRELINQFLKPSQGNPFRKGERERREMMQA
jgi:hypothetical protein